MHGRHLAAAALGVAAITLPAAPAAAKQVRITEDASGKTVTLRQGDTLRIALPANETTGYRWQVTWRPQPDVARITRSKYRQGAKNRIGAGGVQIYRLRTVGPGRAWFAAKYAQVGSGTVGERFRVRIHVR